MALEPEDRYGTCKALSDDIEALDGRGAGDSLARARDAPLAALGPAKPHPDGGSSGGTGGRHRGPCRRGRGAARANSALNTANNATNRALHEVRQAHAQTQVALAQSEESRRQAEAVGAFLVDAFRSPDPRQTGRDVKVIDVLDNARAKLEAGFAGSLATRGAFWTRWGRRTRASGSTTEP